MLDGRTIRIFFTEKKANTKYACYCGKVTEEQVIGAVNFVHTVFNEFFAGDYSQKGQKTFSDYLESKLEELSQALNNVHKRMRGLKNDSNRQNLTKKINEFDGFIFVTAEYNHGIPGALKNAIDYLNMEWKNKAVGFVAYGSAGGTRAVESLRLVAAELHMADVRAQVMLSLFTDFQNKSVFTPDPRHERSLNDVFDQVIAWSDALKTLRV